MTVTLVNLPDEQPGARLAWLAQTVAPAGASLGEVLVREGPVRSSSPDTRLFELLAEEARTRYGVTAGVQLLYRSSSDSRFLRGRGITCYGLSPYLVNYAQSLSIHGVNESITVSAFVDGVEYLRNAVRAWAEE